MDPQGQSPGDEPPPGSIARLKQQAKARLGQLLQQLETSDRQECQAADRLTEQTEQKLQRQLDQIERAGRHTYGVFTVGGGGRRMVLRDVAELDGRKPLYTSTDFEAAIHLAGERLHDSVHASRPPFDPDALRRSLQRLLDELHRIEADNARLQGSGTEADPYDLADGPLRVRAPISLGFSGVSPADLICTPHRHLVSFAAQTSPAS